MLNAKTFEVLHRYLVSLWSDIQTIFDYMATLFSKNRAPFLQTMAGRLFGDKPLSEPILGYYHLDHLGQTALRFVSLYDKFH